MPLTREITSICMDELGGKLKFVYQKSFNFDVERILFAWKVLVGTLPLACVSPGFLLKGFFHPHDTWTNSKIFSTSRPFFIQLI